MPACWAVFVFERSEDFGSDVGHGAGVEALLLFGEIEVEIALHLGREFLEDLFFGAAEDEGTGRGRED